MSLLHCLGLRAWVGFRGRVRERERGMVQEKSSRSKATVCSMGLPAVVVKKAPCMAFRFEGSTNQNKECKV